MYFEEISAKDAKLRKDYFQNCLGPFVKITLLIPDFI